MQRTGWIIALSSVLVACAADGSPTTVTFKNTGGPLDVVAYREDGLAWKTATRVDLDTYVIDVSGPYWISVTCHAVFGERSWTQYARTMDDPHELEDELCPEATANLYSVTGTMVQPGSLSMTSWVQSKASDWQFHQTAAPGSYTLYAASDSHVLIQRALQITDNVELPAIDVDASGAAFVAQPFTIANPRAGAALTQVAVIGVEPATELLSNEAPLYFYIGDPATAHVIPSAALTDGDIQTVSLRETTDDGSHTTLRASRKAYQAGDSTELSLPEPLGDVIWSTDGASVTWSSRAADYPMWLQSASSDGITHSIDASAAFLNDTRRHGVTFDTSAPGVDDSFAINFARTHYFVASSQLIGDTLGAPRLSATDGQYFEAATDD